MLSDHGESNISPLVDNSNSKHNEIFGELAAGRLPAKIFCNPRNLIDISN